MLPAAALHGRPGPAAARALISMRAARERSFGCVGGTTGPAALPRTSHMISGLGSPPLAPWPSALDPDSLVSGAMIFPAALRPMASAVRRGRRGQRRPARDSGGHWVAGSASHRRRGDGRGRDRRWRPAPGRGPTLPTRTPYCSVTCQRTDSPRLIVVRARPMPSGRVTSPERRRRSVPRRRPAASRQRAQDRRAVGGPVRVPGEHRDVRQDVLLSLDGTRRSSGGVVLQPMPQAAAP